jgi:hypothetical protein
VPIAAIIDSVPAPIALPPWAGPRRQVNREVRVGDIVVEIGDPLPPRQAAEHAGSLTASIPRPSLQPRRRL